MKTNKAKTCILSVGLMLALLSSSVAWAQTPAANTTSLNEIIKNARTWDAAFQGWYGKTVPKLKVTDLKGKTYQLDQLKGKDVLVVFWATWCGPCQHEIPHLKKLREQYKEKDLAIVAISNESARSLKQFVKRKKMNYSVVSLADEALPAPFSLVRSIPSMFFVDKQGEIKLATTGVVSLAETKAIIGAK